MLRILLGQCVAAWIVLGLLWAPSQCDLIRTDQLQTSCQINDLTLYTSYQAYQLFVPLESSNTFRVQFQTPNKLRDIVVVYNISSQLFNCSATYQSTRLFASSQEELVLIAGRGCLTSSSLTSDVSLSITGETYLRYTEGADTFYNYASCRGTYQIKVGTFSGQTEFRIMLVFVLVLVTIILLGFSVYCIVGKKWKALARAETPDNQYKMISETR